MYIAWALREGFYCAIFATSFEQLLGMMPRK